MPELKEGQRVEVTCYETPERGVIEQVKDDSGIGDIRSPYFVRLDADQDGLEWRGWFGDDELRPLPSN